MSDALEPEFDEYPDPPEGVDGQDDGTDVDPADPDLDEDDGVQDDAEAVG